MQVVWVIRRATLDDIPALRKFTDFWLAGRGRRVRAPGAVNDCFISPAQHRKYIVKYSTSLLFQEELLIGWAVIQHDGSLIHFLIAGSHRRQGFGKRFLLSLCPKKIHSKADQSSGDPGGFYKHLGYHKTRSIQSKSRLDIDKIRPNRKPNIDIFERLCSRSSLTW